MTSQNNTSSLPDLVNVDLLSFHFRFKKLLWKEELGIKVLPKQDPIRIILAHALHDVSDLIPQSLDDSLKVIFALPEAIKERVWLVYRGSMPPSHRFSTADLYKAPPPSVHIQKIEEDLSEEELLHERTVKEMENRFGVNEVAEEAELSRRILAAAIKDRSTTPQPPPNRRRRG